MEIRLFGLVSIGLFFLLSSCATTIRDFSQKTPFSNEDTQAILFGHFQIEYNGVVSNSRCAVCFEGAESGCYKLPKSGNVLMRVTAGETRIKRVSCLDSVEYHVYPKDFVFKTLPKQRNYFGDVTVKWNNPGAGFQWGKFFDFMGAIVNDKKPDGTAAYEVADQMDLTLSQLESLLPEEDALPLNACLITKSE
jgi:hypothetical protein